MALLPAALALARSAHAHDAGLYESLRAAGRIDRPALAATQHVLDSPAPRAANPGRWMPKAPLLVPRSEMAWAAEHAGRMHLVGGYGEQRVDRSYHHVYEAASDRWTAAAPLPRGANHVGVAVLDGRLYAVGGFVEQNRRPHDECFAYDLAADRWERIAPLPAPCGSVACVGLGGRVHGIGGAIGDTFPTKKSVDWHLVYDPKADRWERRAPMPTPRHGLGAVAIADAIYVAGGGAVMGGDVQSAVHEAFTLAAG